MDKREIQITFPQPGEWGKFKAIALYEYDGYKYQRGFTQGDVPAEHRAALGAVTAAIVGIGAEWQAECVTVKFSLVNSEFSAPLAQGGEVEEHSSSVPEVEYLEFTVYARNERGGRRAFTGRDYRVLRTCDAGAVAFFKYFTGMAEV